MTKIGRNDPCPCGSKKKYKKCCLGKKVEISQQKLQEMALEAMQKNHFIDQQGIFVGRRPITTLHTLWKSRVRGVGNKVYKRPSNATFHQFLGFYLSETLGHEWLANEIKKPAKQIHPVAIW